jgi:hypothetical protein
MSNFFFLLKGGKKKVEEGKSFEIHLAETFSRDK